MQGTLFTYGPKSTQRAFKSANASARQLVLIGGLTDGLLFASYAPALAIRLAALGWGLTQAQLSSSYQGYGTASLDQDAQELLLLLAELEAHHGVTQCILMGSSTGCQDVVRWVQRFSRSSSQGAQLVAGTILQAPVSDQEWLLSTGSPQLAQLLDKARAMAAEGDGQDIVGRLDDIDGAPITASRLLALAERRDDDDMFSTYLENQELEALLWPLNLQPCLLLISGADQYVPAHVDQRKQATRMAAAIGAKGYGQAVEVKVIEGGKHGLEGHEQEAADAVADFVVRAVIR